MTKLDRSVIVVVLLCLITALPSCASVYDEKPISVEIEGLVKIKGNEPFTRVVLEADNGHVYELTGPLAVELESGYSLQRVRILGELDAENQDAAAYGTTKLRVIEYTGS